VQGIVTGRPLDQTSAWAVLWLAWRVTHGISGPRGAYLARNTRWRVRQKLGEGPLTTELAALAPRLRRASMNCESAICSRRVATRTCGYAWSTSRALFLQARASHPQPLLRSTCSTQRTNVRGEPVGSSSTPSNGMNASRLEKFLTAMLVGDVIDRPQ